MSMNFEKCNGCKRTEAGSCTSCNDNPLKNAGESNMTDMDKMVRLAFGEKEKPELKDEGDFIIAYRLGKDGQMRQTEESKRDEAAYNKGRKEKIVEESKNLSLTEQIVSAMGKTGYDHAKYL